MRLLDTLDEARRNVSSGTTRALSLALALAAGIGVLADVDLATTGTLLNRTDAYVAAGASTYIIESSGNVDATACEALTAFGRIQSAGALRRMPDAHVAALPSNPVPVYEATRGWWQLQVPDATGSLLASADFTTTVAADASAPRLRASGLPIDGVYQWPSDGRDSQLSYALVARGAAGAYDECWVRMADPTDTPGGLLSATLREPVSDPQQAQTRPLNGRLGELTTFSDFEHRPTAWAPLGCALLGALVSVGALRLRALELAAAKAVGVPPVSQLAQSWVEALVWTCAGTTIASSWLIARVVWIAPRHAVELAAVLAPIIAAGALGALVSVPPALWLLTRRPVDHYIRRRSG